MPSLRKLWDLSVASILIALTSAACSPTPSPQLLPAAELSVPPTSLTEYALPPLPAAPVSRQAAYDIQRPVNGADTFRASVNTTIEGNDLVLAPSGGDLAYAIYEIGMAPWQFSAVSYDIAPAEWTKVWLAVADYSTMEWRFTQPASGSTSLAVSAGELYSSTGGAYFAVFAFDDTTVRVTSVSVQVTLPTWQSYTFELDTDSTFDLKLIGDRLYLLYKDGYFDIRLAWANIPEPEIPMHWTRVTVPPYPNGDIWTLRLADIQGRPGVAFYSSGVAAVMYYQAKIAMPQELADWQLWTLDFATDEDDLAFTEIDGKPALAYFTEDLAKDSWLTFAYPNNPDPSSLADWNFTHVAECPPSDYGKGERYLALCDMDGAAALGYFDAVAMDYYYMRANNGAPQSPGDWTTCRLGSTSFWAVGPWIGEYSESPVAVYRDMNIASFQFAVADRFSPTSESHWQKHAFAKDIGNGDYFNCCEVGNGLGVAYEHNIGIATYHLFYYWFDEEPPSNGAGWKWQDLMDPDVGGFEDENDDLGGSTRPSVASSAAGRPHIAYYDYHAGSTGNYWGIKIAHLAPES